MEVSSGNNDGSDGNSGVKYEVVLGEVHVLLNNALGMRRTKRVYVEEVVKGDVEVSTDIRTMNKEDEVEARRR